MGADGPEITRLGVAGVPTEKTPQGPEGSAFTPLDAEAVPARMEIPIVPDPEMSESVIVRVFPAPATVIVPAVAVPVVLSETSDAESVIALWPE